MSRQYKERRLYFSDNCEKCGNPFQSFKRAKIKHGLCRKCRRNQPDPNQQGLFTEQDQKIIDAGGTVVREGMIAGEKHTLELSKGKLVEKINDKPVLVMGEMDPEPPGWDPQF